MSSLPQRILPYIYYISTGVSISANTLLIWLILKKTNYAMRNYSHVLLQAAIADIMASIVYVVVQCQMEVAGGYAFIRSPTTWMNKLQGQYKCIQIALYGIAADTVAVSVPIQCIFRYYVIFKKKNLSMLTILSIYSVCFLITAFFGVFDWQAYEPISPNSEPAKILLSFEIWKNEPNILETFCAGKILSFGILSFIFCVSVVANISLIVIIYTTRKVHRFLVQSASHLTAKTIDLQNQFSRMVFSQTILPVIASIIMMVINITGVTLQNYEGGLYLFLFVIYSIISAINPITTILCIKNYRDTVFCKQRRSVGSSYLNQSEHLPQSRVTRMTSHHISGHNPKNPLGLHLNVKNSHLENQLP